MKQTINWLRLLLVGVLSVGVVAGCGQNRGNSTVDKMIPLQQQAPATKQESEKSPPVPAVIQEKPQTLQKLVVASPVKALVFLPTFIGVAKGLFEEQGYSVENVIMKTDVAVSALVSGNIDYATPIGTTIRAAATGIPVKVIMGITTEMLTSLITKPEVKSINELRGKIIASSSAGASSSLAGFTIFRANGMEPGKDVEFVYLGVGENRLAALASGKIDGAMLTVPDEELLGLKQGYKRLVYYPDVFPGHPFGGLGASEQKIKEKPEEIKKVIKAVINSINYIFKNKKDTIDFISTEWNLDMDDANKAYEDVVHAFSKDGSISEKGLLLEINATKENAKITEDIPLGKVSDFTLLKEVQSEMGL